MELASFTIVKDHIATETGTTNRTGIRYTFRSDRWLDGPAHDLKLYDDDGILNYTIKINVDDDHLDDAAEAVHDWGTWDAGTTFSKLDGKPFIG